MVIENETYHVVTERDTKRGYVLLGGIKYPIEPVKGKIIRKEIQ